MENAVLAIDCGTSGLKGALITRSGRLATIPPVGTTAIPRAAADAQEWGPREGVGDLAKCLFFAALEASEQQMKISAIALTTTTSSIVCVDMASRLPLDSPPPMRWDDLQACKEACEVEECRVGARAFPWMSPVRPDTGIAKSCFLLKRHPETFVNSSLRIMEQWTFYNWWLTGKSVQSETILSRKWGLTEKNAWPKQFTDAIAQRFMSNNLTSGQKCDTWLTEKFLSGPILPAGKRVGTLRPSVCEITGLPRGIPVFAAPYDTCAQVMGLGLVAPNGSLGISLGTSLGICAIVERGDQPQGRFYAIPEVPIQNCSMLFDGIASCGSAINYIAARFGAWAGDKPDFVRMTGALKRTAPGSRGVTMLPYFAGGRRATISGSVLGRVDGLNIGIGDSEILRSLFEALAFIVRLIIEDLEKSLPTPTEKIVVGGGPSRNLAFMQLLSDVLNRPLEVSPYSDTALLGTALCEACGLRWFKSFQAAARALIPAPHTVTPVIEVAQKYEDLYKTYCIKYGEEIGYSPK